MHHIFFSYSHRDEAFRNELAKHLTILKRNGIIDTWHDREISAGKEIDKEIDSHLKSADVILLLISPDFLASDYCYDIEMKEAMKMHDAGAATVIPVILRHCDWHETPFGKLLATPTDGRPVNDFADHDQAFLDVTKAIKKSLRSTPRPTAPAPTTTGGTTRPASSNLNIPKKFTDREKDLFLSEAFDYIASYIENSLAELMQQNAHVETTFQRVDRNIFTSQIYVQGNGKAQSTIFIGGMGHASRAISFSNQITRQTNSLNESLSIVEDGYHLLLQPLGMMSIGMSEAKEKLSKEQAAEFYWKLTIRPLQNRY